MQKIEYRWIFTISPPTTSPATASTQDLSSPMPALQNPIEIPLELAALAVFQPEEFKKAFEKALQADFDERFARIEKEYEEEMKCQH